MSICRQEISKGLHFLRVSLSLDLRSYGQGCCPRTTQHAPELLPLTSAACKVPLPQLLTPPGEMARRGRAGNGSSSGTVSFCGTSGGNRDWRSGAGQLQWPLAAENGATSLHGVERGQSSLGTALASRMDSATPSGAWKMLFLLVGFFQSWNGTERREGLVRFQVPTRVSKLREWGVLRIC